MLTPYFLWLPLLLKLVVLDVPKALVPMNKLLLMDGFVMVVEDVGKIKPVMNRHLVLVDLVAFMVVDGVAKTGLNKNPLMISLDLAFVLDLDAERVASLLMKMLLKVKHPLMDVKFLLMDFVMVVEEVGKIKLVMNRHLVDLDSFVVEVVGKQILKCKNCTRKFLV
jgi:hypothetical protein